MWTLTQPIDSLHFLTKYVGIAYIWPSYFVLKDCEWNDRNPIVTILSIVASEKDRQADMLSFEHCMELRICNAVERKKAFFSYVSLYSSVKYVRATYFWGTIWVFQI